MLLFPSIFLDKENSMKIDERLLAPFSRKFIRKPFEKIEDVNLKSI